MSSLLRNLVIPIAEKIVDGGSVYLRVPQLKDWPAWLKVREDSRSTLPLSISFRTQKLDQRRDSTGFDYVHPGSAVCGTSSVVD